MSEEAAQDIMDRYQKWDDHNERRNFIAKMEHKLHSKERRVR